MVRVASYIRVSKEEQVQGYSIEGQLDSTRRYAEERGWQVVKEYIDPGYSARTDKRPAFKTMIADAKNGDFEIVLVLKGDRFARNRGHAAMYKQLLDEVGVRVISVTEPAEAGTPAGVIVEGISEVIAEWYSVDLSVKVTSAKRRRAEKGLWNGPVPFGYRVGNVGLLAVVVDEAEIVAEAFGKYATGRHTDQSLATWLNQTNFRPRVHRRERKQKQAVWSKDTVGSMLTNSFYLGYVKYKGELLPGQHSAVVSQAVFDSVQAIRKQHRRGPSTFAPRHRTYLLSGLIRSVQCGEKLAAHHISRNDYYQDTCIRRGLPCSDSMRYVRGDSVDAQVSGIISSLKLPYSWRDQVLTMLSSRGEIEEVQNEKARLDEKMRRLKRQYREVEIDEAEYRQELQLTQAKLATLTVPEQEEMVHLGDHVEGMVVAWQQATKEERRDMLRLMLEAVYVDMDTKEVVGLRPKPAFLPLFNLEQPVMANNNVVLTTNLTADGPDSGRGRHCNTSFDSSA